MFWNEANGMKQTVLAGTILVTEATGSRVEPRRNLSSATWPGSLFCYKETNGSGWNESNGMLRRQQVHWWNREETCPERLDQVVCSVTKKQTVLAVTNLMGYYWGNTTGSLVEPRRNLSWTTWPGSLFSKDPWTRPWTEHSLRIRTSRPTFGVILYEPDFPLPPAPPRLCPDVCSTCRLWLNCDSPLML